MHENILVTGITDLEYYPRNSLQCTCKSNVINTVLTIPNEKPDIESINEIKVDSTLCEYTIIKTILGPKLIAHGTINIKVIYVADNKQQTVHSSRHCVLFSDFILLSNLVCKKTQYAVHGVFIGVENVHVNTYDKRCVNLSAVYLMCPKLYRTSKCESTVIDDDDDKRYYECDSDFTDVSLKPCDIKNNTDSSLLTDGKICMNGHMKDGVVIENDDSIDTTNNDVNCDINCKLSYKEDKCQSSATDSMACTDDSIKNDIVIPDNTTSNANINNINHNYRNANNIANGIRINGRNRNNNIRYRNINYRR